MIWDVLMIIRCHGNDKLIVVKFIDIIHRQKITQHWQNDDRYLEALGVMAFLYMICIVSQYQTKSQSWLLFHISLQLQILTTHLLSIERADWTKLHDMFKARDAEANQREFPVGVPVRVCASNLLLFNIFLDIIVRIESRCVIKAKHVLLVCYLFDFSLEKLHSRWNARAFFPRKNRTN